MNPHGVHNYCCGGGGGFAIMSGMNIGNWKLAVSGRMKVKQVLEAFRECIGPETPKYVCTPCSNCKAQLRDLITYYELESRANIHYTGLADLIVNAMADTPMRYLEPEEIPKEMISEHAVSRT